MRPHKRFGALEVVIGLLLVAGCAPETATPPAPRTSANPPAMAGRSPSERFPASSQREKSSLDAHREGSAVSSGPMKEAFFEFDSYNLTAEARKILQANAAWLKANPAATVEIEGHCDERGTTEYNLALGAKRARAAMDYLLALGVSPSRIKTTSYGEELPACKEATESCYQKNRRDQPHKYGEKLWYYATRLSANVLDNIRYREVYDSWPIKLRR